MGVRFLLDTHVLLWLLSAPDRVPAGVRGMLANRDNQLLVSAASGLEIATKMRVGKLAAPVLPATLSARRAGHDRERHPGHGGRGHDRPRGPGHPHW